MNILSEIERCIRSELIDGISELKVNAHCFVVVQVQRRARFGDASTEPQWLTSTQIPASINSFLSIKDGTLGAFVSGHSRTWHDGASQNPSCGMLERSYVALPVKFPEHDDEIRVGDLEIVISKCQQNSSERRTILGRTVRVVVLDRAETNSEEVPICEVKIPVLPDGTSAVLWANFRGMVTTNAGQWVDTTSFSYVPCASTRLSYAPWCLKTSPETHISHVEDQIEQGISGYGIKLRQLRLERLARHVTLAKDITGHPVLMEMTLIHEEMQVYHDQPKREKLCKMLSEVIGESVKIVVVSKGSQSKATPAGKKKDHVDDSKVLKPGQCEIVDAIEVKESGLQGIWLAVRYGLESPEHVKEFVSQLDSPDELQKLEDLITKKISESTEEKLRRATWPKSCPVLARMNMTTPVFSSADSVQSEILELSAFAVQSPHLELFRWKGLTLRYKGQQPWAQRHVQGQGKSRPYFYIDHATEHTLYSSSGIVYVEDAMDFKEAVQNVVHREAFARTASGDFVLYLTSVKGYSLLVRSAHPDLVLDHCSSLEGGVKVSIQIDSSFDETRAALRRALDRDVFFSYIYKAEVKVEVGISIPTDTNVAVYEEHEQVLFEAIRQLMGLKSEEWKSKSRVRRHEPDDNVQYIHITLYIRDIAIWKAEQIMQSLCRREDWQKLEAHVAHTDNPMGMLHQNNQDRSQLEWLKSRILECMQAQLGYEDGNTGALGFHRANMRIPAMPVIEASKKLVDHAEEFQVAMKILSEDAALRRTLTVEVQGVNRMICFCNMTQGKQSRLLSAQHLLASAEKELMDFQESLIPAEKVVEPKKSAIKASSGTLAKGGGAEIDPGDQSIFSARTSQLFGTAPAPPNSLVWGSWKPSAAQATQLRPHLFFEADEHASLVWVTANGSLTPPKPFVFGQWYQVQCVLPLAQLRKVGDSPFEWFIVPYFGFKSWVNCKMLLDPTWREKQTATISPAQPGAVPEEPKPQQKMSRTFGFRKKEAKIESGPTTATVVAVQTILALVNMASLELVETLWNCIVADASPAPKTIIDKDLLQLPAAKVQMMLEIVVRNWLDINVNLLYIRARQFIARHRSEQDEVFDANGKPALDQLQKLARERFNQTHLGHLRVAVQERMVQVGRHKVETTARTSGAVQQVPAVDGGAPRMERKLDVIEVPWECSWYTMQNRMQVLTGHNTDDLIFVFHTDVDVDMCGAHDLISSMQDSPQKSEAKGTQSRHAKRLEGVNLQNALYSAPATGQALKSHPSVDIWKVEKEMMKYTDILHLNRTGKGTAGTGDVLFMMQRVSRAIVNDENVYVWKQGVEDGAEWVLLLYQGQYSWNQRAQGTYAYLDICSKEVVYLHRGMADYVVKDELTFSAFCRLLHHRKLMNNTAVIQVVPQHIVCVKDSEMPSEHRETSHFALSEGVQWDAVPHAVSNRMGVLASEISRLKERASAAEDRKVSGRQVLKRMTHPTRESASVCMQRVYRRRLMKRKLELLSTMHYRYDSVRTRLQSCTGRPSIMYYYVPENIINPYIKRGWHWVETEEQFETMLTLLEQKGVEDASLLCEHLAASTYAKLKMEEDLKGHDALMDVMSTWNYNNGVEMMERHRTGQFDQELRQKMKLDGLLADEAYNRVVLAKCLESKRRTEESKGKVSDIDLKHLTNVQDSAKHLESRILSCQEALKKAHHASIQAINHTPFTTYIQNLALGVLAFRANMSADLYAELDARQVRAGTEFLLGGSKQLSLPNLEAAVQDFDTASEILTLLRLPRGIQGQHGDRGQSAVNSVRAVKMVGLGLKRLKHLLKTDLYDKLEAEDLKAILYREVLQLHQNHVSELEAFNAAPPAPSRETSIEQTTTLQHTVSFSAAPRGLRRTDSKIQPASRSLAATSSKGSFASRASNDDTLFRPGPHFVSKQEMRGWKSTLQVFEAARQAFMDAQASPTCGPPLLVECLGLKFPNPEKFYRTIYVVPLLTFHVRIGGGVCDVQVPDWLDWDPTSFFHQQITPSRKAIPHPLSSKLQLDGTPLLGGMVHELRELYTAGRPSRMSFTYLPTCKIQELEAQIQQLRLPLQHANKSAHAPAKTNAERAQDLEDLERKAHTCRRGVTVSDFCEITLAQGVGQLHGNSLKLDEAVADLSGWDSLKGCLVYYVLTSAKPQTVNTRKLVLDFDAKTKCCTLEESKKKSKSVSAVDVKVFYRLTSEITFKITAKDDERVCLRRQAAVPYCSRALDHVYPFVGDEIVLPRAAALRMHVRLTQVLSAIRNEHEDSQSAATTTLPGHGYEEVSERGARDDVSSDVLAHTAPPNPIHDSEMGWRVLDGCDQGDVVSMHDFTFCKCVMLSLTKRKSRHGGVQWSSVGSGQLDIDVPLPAVAQFKKKVRGDDTGTTKLMAQTRLNRANIYYIPFNLAEFFGDSRAFPEAAAAAASAAGAVVSTVSEPIQLALCDVSELNAQDADVALAEMDIKAVLDCGKATRLVPTAPGGPHGGKPVALSAGGGVSPWQLSQGKVSLEDIHYKAVPFEDVQPADVAKAASFFQEVLSFILSQLSAGRTRTVLLAFSDLAATASDAFEHDTAEPISMKSPQQLKLDTLEREQRDAQYTQHRLASTGSLVAAGFFLWCVERHVQWKAWQMLAVDILGDTSNTHMRDNRIAQTGAGEGLLPPKHTHTYFKMWLTQREAVKRHLDSKALLYRFRAAGVDLFPDTAPVASSATTDPTAPNGEEGHVERGRGLHGEHLLLTMSRNLEALGESDVDVLSRLALDPLVSCSVLQCLAVSFVCCSVLQYLVCVAV